MIIPMANVACNDETVCDYKLNKDESTDESNLVCLLVGFTRLFS